MLFMRRCPSGSSVGWSPHFPSRGEVSAVSFFPGDITNATVQESDLFLLDRWINACVTGLWTVWESYLLPEYKLIL